MNFKYLNFKIYLGSAYLIVLLAGIYFLFSNFDISDLTNYEFIREKKVVENLLLEEEQKEETKYPLN